LGLDQEVVGITKFCVHPYHWQNEKQVVGGTKDFSLEAIDKLKPDLIIGNKEENDKTRIELLQQKYPVWISDINSLEEAKEMIAEIGQMVNRIQRADEILKNISTSFLQIKKRSSERVLYLIWRKPWMGAGAGTFIHDMLEQLGFVNCLASVPRYPQLSANDINLLKPEHILLSSEPYPFKEKHRAELKNIISSSKINFVDGEMFSWYGSRLIKAPEYFNSLPF
jgi:ABC-type Fe3+-hydroxamate transport system substrate-binding protein